MPSEAVEACQGGEDMRLLRRTIEKVLIVPRSVKADGLGGIIEDFSGEGREAEASVSYVANTLSASGNNVNSAMYGARLSQAVRLRMAPEAEISAGDGVMLSGDDAVAWRCVQVDAYHNVKVARLERIAGGGE